MRRENSSILVDFDSEKGMDNSDRTYFAYVPLEDMACYAVAESYDNDKDINSAKLAVESVITAFERNPSFRNLRKYLKYAHDQILANSVKNKLEVAITVVVTDFTRIRYASCGNIKLYLLCENAFYHKSETQTYYQNAANEFGVEKAPISENKNLIKYLGMKGFLRPYISRKIDLLEETTILFATCSFWERMEDIEILDAYEESKPDTFISNIEEMHLLTQLQNPAIKSYTLASLFVEKTFKEDTAKKKKRRRNILIGIAIAVLLVIIVFIVFTIIRASDRSTLTEIERLDREGIRYSDNGNYTIALEQYKKASELTEKLRRNFQFSQEKQAKKELIADRLLLFNNINSGDENIENGNYTKALDDYQNAQAADNRLYETTNEHSGIKIEERLSDRIDNAFSLIQAKKYIEMGKSFDYLRQYQRALDNFEEAEKIAEKISNLELRLELMPLILETEKKLQEEVESGFISYIRKLMKDAIDNMKYERAKDYCEIILNLYEDMNATDLQSKEDWDSIEEKITLNGQAEHWINEAKKAADARKYNDAVTYYDTVMGIYDEMQVDQYNEQRLKILEEQKKCSDLDAASVIEAQAEIPDGPTQQQGVIEQQQETAEQQQTGVD
jgi:tetratricopeptide (TPR) repeat protein